MRLDILAQAEKLKNCPTGKSNAFDSRSNPECFTNLPQVAANQTNLRNLLSITFGIAAAIAVVSLAIAAINFATAATDADKITRSRRAIIYSLIGLVIALSAETIVLTLIDKI